MSNTRNPMPIDPLWEAYRMQGKSPVLRDRLVEHYFPLVPRMVAGILRLLPGNIDRHLVESAAGEGLIEAVERFEHDRKCSFRTFANRVMRRRVQDALRRIDRDPLRHASRDVEQLEQLYVRESLAEDLEDAPLQVALGPTDPGAASLLSLVAILHGSACQALELRTRAILFLSFVGKFRQREIAQLLEITEARVSQILRQAKNHLSRSVSIRIDK